MREGLPSPARYEGERLAYSGRQPANSPTASVENDLQPTCGDDLKSISFGSSWALARKILLSVDVFPAEAAWPIREPFR